MARWYYNSIVKDTLTVRLNGDLARKLAKEAERSNRSKGQIVREALEERFARSRPSVFDKMSKFCGIISGPADLSLNKKYLAGFGRRKARG